MSTLERPLASEYAPFYAGYVQRVPAGNIYDLLTQQLTETKELLANLTESQAMFRPAPQEWSIKEVLGHVNDGERIFFYRAMCISRQDPNSLPGFDQNDYVRAAHFDNWSFADLLREFELIRLANLQTLKYLSPETSLQLGTVRDTPISVRALVYIMAGHVDHHLESLRQDYLAKMG